MSCVWIQFNFELCYREIEVNLELYYWEIGFRYDTPYTITSIPLFFLYYYDRYFANAIKS